ncbi:MAG: AAA family ATPase [Bacteroidales bacterium]|nr:AAA family ATPase [Bacteroidales bacterium]
MNKTEQKHFEKLQESRKEDLKVFSKPENRGFLTSVIDKYTESAHFIYELLQNADDACATKAEFRLSHEGLTFVHNGKERFTISDPDKIVEDQEAGKLGHLNAITYTGFSTKDKEGTTNKIGKFGVGFKAVFQYTDTPHIYDDCICFKIEHFFVPYLIEDLQERKKGDTWITLPFNKVSQDKDKAYQEISHRLKQLDNPLLFLHNLKEVKWKDNESHGKYSQKTKEEINIFGVKCEFLLLENTSENKRDRLWMFSEETEIDNRKLPLYVGYYIKNGKIDTENRSNLYCFFPTKKQLDVCFIMHAPFVLTDSREGVREVSDNAYLFHKLALLAAKSLVCLRDIGLSKEHKPLLDEALSKIIITNEPDAKEPLTYFYSAFLQTLRDENLFPSRQKGVYLPASKAYICPQTELRKLLSKDQLTTLTDKAADFVFDNVVIASNDIPYYEKVGVGILTPSIFGGKINSAFLKNQPVDWLKQFYKYLLEHAKPLWKKQETRYGTALRPILTNKPIILLEDGRFSSTILDEIYISNKGLPNTLQVNQELVQDEDIRTFFKAFGLKDEPDVIVHLQKSILPVFKNNSISIDDTDFLWRTLELFAQIYAQNTTDKNEILTCIRKDWKAVGINCKGERKLCTINELYADDIELKRYFVNNSKIMYFDWAFYQIEKKYEKACSVLISDLELPTIPKVLISKRTECGTDYLHSYTYKRNTWNEDLISPYKEILSKVIDQLMERYEYCRDIHATFNDFKLEGLGVAILNIRSIEDSVRIWNYIAKVLHNHKNSNPLEIYCEFKYKPPYARDYSYCQSESKPSLFLNSIKTSAWVYNKVGEKCSPVNLYVENIDNRYGDIEKLAEILGIIHSPKIEDEKHLEQCSEETRQEVELGRQLKSLGLGNYDPSYLAELVRKDEDAKRLEESEQQKRRQYIPKNTPDVFQREPQKEYSAEELFDRKPQPIAHKNAPQTTPTDVLEKIDLEQQEEREEAEHKKELRNIALSCDKYSFLWYKSLLELEFLNSGEASYGKKGVKISFRKMEAEQGSGRMIILKQPSKHIPQALEDCGDITVNFHFNNIDRKCLTFEVANVKDYTLRLKCKNESMDEVAFLLNNSQHLVRADIDTGFPVQLIDKLLKAYEDLPYVDAHSFKGNINRDLHFVFGPPGTGKTTHLAQELKKLMSKDFLNPTTRKSKILVLCPTNKACDVLLQKVEDVCTALKK